MHFTFESYETRQIKLQTGFFINVISEIYFVISCQMALKFKVEINGIIQSSMPNKC